MNSISAHKANAFVLVPQINVDTEQHQVKLNQFLNLVNTCDIQVSKSHYLPEKSLWYDFNVFFIDLYNQSIPYNIPDNILQLANNHKVVFFNVEDDVFDEQPVLLAGINGVFYQHQRPDILLRGIETLKESDFWFKRTTLEKNLSIFLKASRKEKSSQHWQRVVKPVKDGISPALTKREKTIINLVSRGAQNKEIADQLHISPNTVKTHIYSIFRKTSSRNRIELIAWTQQLYGGYALNS